MNRVALLAALVAVVALTQSAAIGTAAAQTKFRLAHTVNTEDSMHLAMVEFSKKVAARTNNAVQIDIFPSGQLGNDVKVLEGVRLGTIDMVLGGNPFFSSFAPEVNVLDLPYLFRDYEHVYKVVDGPVGTDLLRAVEKNGMKLIGVVEIGFRNITNNKRPVKTPDDVKGLKVRTTPNPAHLAAWRMLGANPVPMPFTEVYLALKTGAVDGQENPVMLMHAMKFHEVQKYLSMTRHAYTAAHVVINLGKYQALTPDQQKAMHESVREAATWQRKFNRDREGQALAAMKAAGVVVEENPDHEAFRKVVGEAVAEDYVKRFGRETLEKIRNTR